MSTPGADGKAAVVVVFAATRADLSPLIPVLTQLLASPAHVVLIASSAIGGSDRNPAAVQLPQLEIRVLPGDITTSAVAEQTQAGAELSGHLSTALDDLEPDVFVVLGDRWELLYVVPPVVLRGIPLVHLHGGEVTEGAIDDRVRHAVTKLADVHCVSTEDAARRVRQLGEPPERVHVTGAPGLDRATGVEAATDGVLAQIIGADVRRPLALVTYHPVTVDGARPGPGAAAVLEAVARHCASVIITHPGMDHGRDAVLSEIDRAVAGHAGWVAVPTLGSAYLPVLAAADVVVGNSSSGVVEAASFGVPAVDVGDRQRGRPTGANVIHCAEDCESVAAGIARALTPEFRAGARGAVNIYGDGNSAPRVVELILQTVGAPLSRKPFIDGGR